MTRSTVLFLNVLLIATCGLIYELLAGTVASYVLGDSVTQFSLVIGIYLAALGLGAWLSRYLNADLARRFVEIELGVALLGGFSAMLLFLTFAHARYFSVGLYSVVIAVGVLVGLELPILMRIMRDHLEFKDLVSRILAFDYLGALLASLLFPLLLVPRLGLVRTSLLTGLVNAGVALWATYLLAPTLTRTRGLRLRALLVMVVLGVGVLQANRLTSLVEDEMYADEIVYAQSTPYQRIVVTHGTAGFNLFLNGHLQFSSADEYRYHEALVHPPMTLAHEPHHVLILGGGDGLALREVLKFPGVQDVTLVDLDPAMTTLANHFPPLADLNQHSFSDPRVHVINQDAMIWLEPETTGDPSSNSQIPNSQFKIPPPSLFDVIIVDFPDPNSFALGKLYTTRFYRLLKHHLSSTGAISVQSTSPLFARKSYWCIIRTLEAAGFHVRPYHVTVPSFGVWGFALACLEPFDPPTTPRLPGKFINADALSAMFIFSADMGPVHVEINRLDNQALVRYYESEWRRWE